MTRQPGHSTPFTPAQPSSQLRRRTRSSVRGWAIWAAAVAIVLLLNAIVWTLVVAY